MVLSPRASAPAVRGLTLRSSPLVLCAERVVRITKTYHDIDAVTNLLDEVRWCLLAQGLGACGTPGTCGGGRAGEGGQSRGWVPADADLPLAEGAGPGAGGAHRAVPAEAEPEPDRAQRAPGGAARVGQGGGNCPWVQGPGLAPSCTAQRRLWSPWPCPDVPFPLRSRSCATRSPCGTTCSTSTPPRQRRASLPPPPPCREWGIPVPPLPRGRAAPGGQAEAWGRSCHCSWGSSGAGAPFPPVGAAPQGWVAADPVWALGGAGRGLGWQPHPVLAAGTQCPPCHPQAAPAGLLAVPAAVLPVRHLAAETEEPGGGEPEAPHGGEQGQLLGCPSLYPPLPRFLLGGPEERLELLPIMLSPSDPFPRPPTSLPRPVSTRSRSSS